MKPVVAVLFTLFSHPLFAQHILKGNVMDEKGQPVLFATIALMHPSDSTLAFFGVSDKEGFFEIKNIKEGNYILQSAFIGYQTFYRSIDIPLKTGNDIGTILMKMKTVSLSEVEVNSERIPLLIKKDTIEYDAGAFKTKPDAAAEDLLKKLPGVEVDRAGNIKAQGEDVKNVLVDGKEFFSSDPKVATKNLPADAVKKVQVYDKKSDEAELTGIDDGSRNKTINLLLKDDKKSAWMGDAQAGAGTDSHYQSSVKAYRFTKQSQFAAMGMLNNINQFGFSFRDYIDFNGGMSSLMSGGGEFRISSGDNNNFPINFGQPVTGLITSGAGGLNYTYEKKKDNRFNISYLGNGADKDLVENINTQNFVEGNSFSQDEYSVENTASRIHRFNLNWRNKLDSTQNLIASGNVSFNNGNNSKKTFSQSYRQNYLENDFNGNAEGTGDGFNINSRASYLKKGEGRWRLFKIAGDMNVIHSLKENEWNNVAHYYSPDELFNSTQFRNDQSDMIKYSVSSSITIKTGDQFYMVPEMKTGLRNETLKREQGVPAVSDALIDSLSADFKSDYQWFSPAVSLRRSNDRSQFNFTAKIEAGKMSNSLYDDNFVNNSVFYFTPRVSWDYEYKTSHRIRVYYDSYINVPDADQLLPLINNTNSLELNSGNRNLKPEYIHELQLNWILFDQFSFTSVFASLRGTYTKDKINWSRSINDQFGQSLKLINVPDDYRAEAALDFSTPIRKMGINFHVNPTESYNQGINFVNGIENTNTNFIHEFTLSIDNRKKEKWDASIGGALQYTTARYSLQKSLNNNYFNINYFTELNFTPNDHWNFSASADVTQYNAKSFDESISIPILKASVSYYFLKAKRGVIILDAFDLLNKNTGIQRISEMNYLQQKQSGIIGRYIMLSFKYRLNKFDGKGGIEVKVNHK